MSFACFRNLPEEVSAGMPTGPTAHREEMIAGPERATGAVIGLGKGEALRKRVHPDD